MPTDSTLSKVVIVGGMPRSGTNLARRIIGSHSQIALTPVELNFFRASGDSEGGDRALRDPKFRQRYPLNTDDLLGQPPCAVYRELLSRYARHVNKPIAGEKSPRNEFHYRRIHEFLPDSDLRFVHMVRNPFDVVASYKNAPFRGSNPTNDASTVASVAAEWTRSASLAAARTVTEPNRYLMIRFEDLTANTESAAKRICDMIGVDFEPERMLEFSDYEGHADNTSFKKPRHERVNEPKIKQLESRKGHLSEEDIATVGAICGEMALALGYDDDDFQDDAGQEWMEQRRRPGNWARLTRRLRL